MDLIKLNNDGLHHWHFAVFNISRSEQTALISSTGQSLSSASGALLISTVKSNLNYSLILACYSLKKKRQTVIPRSDAAVCDVWSGSTLFGNYFIKSGNDQLQTVLNKKKQTTTHRTEVCSSSTSFNHTQLGLKRPLIFWTCRPGVLQPQCIHMCHTNWLIIRLPALMIHLFTAKRTVKCWFSDYVWIMM